ncbi:hypothetical protein SEA_MARKY_38 [Streptomyces phage Marky]|nr:hypothetical protein SEA_MARKY_38 [Streptomyces phage Marky]
MAVDLTSQCDATASGTEQAYFTWIFVGSGEDALPLELSFCAHHNAKHAAALKLAGWSPFRDDSEKINAKPSVSANV